MYEIENGGNKTKRERERERGPGEKEMTKVCPAWHFYLRNLSVVVAIASLLSATYFSTTTKITMTWRSFALPPLLNSHALNWTDLHYSDCCYSFPCISSIIIIIKKSSLNLLGVLACKTHTGKTRSIPTCLGRAGRQGNVMDPSLFVSLCSHWLSSLFAHLISTLVAPEGSHSIVILSTGVL